jgi:hypothetical protein
MSTLREAKEVCELRRKAYPPKCDRILIYHAGVILNKNNTVIFNLPDC